MIEEKMLDVSVVVSLLLGALMVVYWLWRGGKLGNDTIEQARRIRQHQGYHEAEVSCGGEADLHRHLTRCKKNPGHTHFIPVQDFKIDHLPSDYRYDVILNWIKAQADLTCRLSVRYTSENRPKFHPDRQPLSYYPFYLDRGGDWLRTGTGFVWRVDKYTEKDNRNCECQDCSRADTHTPKKVWGKVNIYTACHVVYDSDEARHTTCEFFYDTSKTHISQCPTLTGLKVKYSNITQDLCCMTYVSHDMDMIEKLYKIDRHRVDLLNKLYNKYNPNKNNSLSVPGSSCVTDPTPIPTVIISHPHGCSKMITVGVCTHRLTWGETFKYMYEDDDKGWEADAVVTSYRYNTPTCRGSSGAALLRLPVKGEYWYGWSTHHHSEGGQWNDNKSAIGGGIVSPPIFH